MSSNDSVFKKTVHNDQFLCSECLLFCWLCKWLFVRHYWFCPIQSLLCPIQIFQRFKAQGIQSTCSGMAALAPFSNGFTYVSFSRFTHLVVNYLEFHKHPMRSCAFAYYVGPSRLLAFP